MANITTQSKRGVEDYCALNGPTIGRMLDNENAQHRYTLLSDPTLDRSSISPDRILHILS